MKKSILVLVLNSCNVTKQQIKPNSRQSVLEKYSKQLNASLTNYKLYYFIDQWMGTPYIYGGKDRSSIDCSHFVHRCYNEVFSPYNFANSNELSQKIKRINRSKLKEGDFIFFKFNSGTVNHVGIYLINNYFVHASTIKGVMISSLSESVFTVNYVLGGSLK